VVTHIIPVVCSAFPEFVWNLQDDYFLIERKLPRVCTYRELVNLLSSDRLNEVETRPFAIKLQ
jgi:hypothetical protein